MLLCTLTQIILKVMARIYITIIEKNIITF